MFTLPAESTSSTASGTSLGGALRGHPRGVLADTLDEELAVFGERNWGQWRSASRVPRPQRPGRSVRERHHRS